MDSIIKRHGNTIVLASVLVAQLLGLAVQIKRPGANDNGSTPLIRTWAVAVISPLEKGFVHSQNWARESWRNYFYLRDVRRENESLRKQIEDMRLEQVRLQEDAKQARRIQTLLGFKEQYVSKTVAAQVIGSSGTQQSRVIYIDKGSNDGLAQNMAVITPDGIVGKILKVWGSTSQVLEITDQTSGVGAALETSRLQGILKGSPAGTAQLDYIMMDEKVEIGEPVITSGGDGIFPKGLPIGKVKNAGPGKNMFLNVQIDPAADLTRLEEVLVITKIEERAPDTKDLGPIRASDILAERLPTVPPKPEGATPGQPGPTTTQPTAGANPNAPKPAGTTPAVTPSSTKPATTTTGAAIAKPSAPSGGATTTAAKPSTTGASKPAMQGANPGTNSATKPAGGATPSATKAAADATKPASSAPKPKPVSKPMDTAAAPSKTTPPQAH